jgi:hypothetical protein
MAFSHWQTTMIGPGGESSIGSPFHLFWLMGGSEGETKQWTLDGLNPQSEAI